MKRALFLILFLSALIGLYLLAQQKTPITPSASHKESPQPFDQEHNHSHSELKKFSKEALKEAFQDSSLAGTDVDRTTLTLIDGQLSLKPELLFYFEYFLTLQGEKNLSTIKKMALTDFRQHYETAIAEKLYDFFLRYIAYRRGLAKAFEQQDLSEIAVENRMMTLEQQVQPRFFNALEIERLFQAQTAIFNRKSQAETQQQKYLAYQQHIQDFPNEAEAAATHFFGTETAQRLQNLQQEDELWQSRLADYRLQYDAIRSHEGFDEYGKEEAIKLLQQRLFIKTEQLRVQALQRNNLLP